MLQYTHYYTRLRGVGDSWTGLPAWGRAIVGIFALPGLALALLSILLLLVSLSALFLLTVPVYLLLRRVIELLPRKREVVLGVEVLDDDGPARPSRAVRATMID
jgi:hypothetical protein